MNPVIIVGAESPEIAKETKMVPPAPMIEALGFAVQHVRRADLDVLIMLHAPLDVPLCVEARIVLGGNLLRAFGN